MVHISSKCIDNFCTKRAHRQYISKDNLRYAKNRFNIQITLNSEKMHDILYLFYFLYFMETVYTFRGQEISSSGSGRTGRSTSGFDKKGKISDCKSLTPS